VTDAVEQADGSGRVFGLGVGVGMALGFVLGAALAWRFGEDAWDGLQALIDRLTGGDDGVNFELLLQ